MKKQLFIVVLLFIAVISGLAVISPSFKTHIKLEKLTGAVKERVHENKEPHVVFQVNTDIDLTTFAIKMYIPCQNDEQKKDIHKVLPKIKNDLIDAIRGEQLSRLIEDREFSRIKKRLIDTINSHLSNRIDDIYLEHFNLVTYNR